MRRAGRLAAGGAQELPGVVVLATPPQRLREGERGRRPLSGSAAADAEPTCRLPEPPPQSPLPPPLGGVGLPWRRSLGPLLSFLPAAPAESAAAARPSPEGGSSASRSGCRPPRAALRGWPCL